MSYYGSDLDTAESSFEDPTAELEANGEADDPEGDLGDGQAQRRKSRLETIDPALLRGRTEKRAI